VSRWATQLSTADENARLDLDDWIGQRSATFRFDAVDILTGYTTPVTPIEDRVPTLEHDVTRTITRSITGMFFGKADTLILNSIRTRLLPYMVIDGHDHPLGVYLYNNQAKLQYTGGVLSTGSFYDQMFIVDQQIENAFSGVVAIGPLGGFPPALRASDTVERLLQDVPITFEIEPSPYPSTGAWPAGTNRGTILQQLALDGDWFPPAFDSAGTMQLRRTFDPALEIPTFDLDTGNRVFQEPPPIDTNDLIDTPNRIIVISNGVTSDANGGLPIMGSYDIPSSAPHSIANRGFVVPKVYSRQLLTSIQAAAVAANIGQRQTIFERVELNTAPDPRHEAYDVVRWQGANWLELAWSLPLREGAAMRHVMRKSYL
jgi:hypothetical protein